MDELHTLRAENERLAAACREFERKFGDAGAKVSELAVTLNEARAMIERLNAALLSQHRLGLGDAPTNDSAEPR